MLTANDSLVFGVNDKAEADILTPIDKTLNCNVKTFRNCLRLFAELSLSLCVSVSV